MAVFFIIAAMAIGQMSPQAILQKMVDSRKASFVTADITWKRSGPDGIHYRRCQIEPKNYTYEEIPDPADGIRVLEELGTPQSCSSINYLVAGDRLWCQFEHGLDAMIWLQKRDPFNPGTNPGGSPSTVDARTLGLLPDRTGYSIDQAMTRALTNPPSAFTLTRDGSLYVVAVTGQNYKVTWWIDPNKGYNPVRSLALDPKSGRVESETTSQLALYDDHVWFPASFTEVSRGRLTLSLLSGHISNNINCL